MCEISKCRERLASERKRDKPCVLPKIFKKIIRFLFALSLYFCVGSEFKSWLRITNMQVRVVCVCVFNFIYYNFTLAP